MKGPFPFRWSLVIPVAVSPDEHISAAIVVAMIPSAMQAAIMSVELYAGTAVVARTVIVAIAAHIDAKPARACGRRRSDGEGRQRGEHVGKLPHCSSPLVVTWRERMPGARVAGNSRKLF